MPKDRSAFEYRTLVGFTEKRTALQGSPSDHYIGAIPMAKVKELFSWQPVEATPNFTYESDGKTITLPNGARKTIARPVGAFGKDDPGEAFETFKAGYALHNPEEWLVQRVENIMDDSLAVAGAGYLKRGAVWWVSIEMPENVETPEGYTFRPSLTALTSLDGSLASVYATHLFAIVCNNMISGMLGSADTLKSKHKHTAGSLKAPKIQGIRDALQVVHTLRDSFSAGIASLSKVPVPAKAWDAFLEAHAPRFKADGEVKEGRALTEAEKVQDTLKRLYVNDNRVSPWAGTALGVVQAVNTYQHHEAIVRGADREARNRERVLSGGIDTLDTSTLATLDRVLQTV